MKVIAALAVLAIAGLACADTYTEGGNNRARYDIQNAETTTNANRLYDSQCNTNGGKPCPNVEPEYVEGSILSVIWTQQHGANNQNLMSSTRISYTHTNQIPEMMHCDPTGKNTQATDFNGVFTNANRNQLAAQDTLTRSQLNSNVPIGYVRPGMEARGRMVISARQHVEGFHRLRGPLNYFDGNENQINSMENNPVESLYETTTRQNQDNDRYGLQLPVQLHYWPNNNCRDQIDLLVELGSPENVTNLCAYYASNSQNVRDRGGCSLIAYPTEQSCTAAGGTWSMMNCDWGVEAPACRLSAMARDNHLGNSVQGELVGEPNWYNYTVGEPGGFSIENTYNISCADYKTIGEGMVDGADNDDKAPLQNNPQYTLGQHAGQDARVQMSFNGAQCQRTFYQTSFKLTSTEAGNECPGGKIVNVEIRGRRGNIVQAYPETEYDFLPTFPALDRCDCIAFQSTGAQTNNYQDGDNLYNNNDNAGEGDDVDCSGIVCTANTGVNTPLTWENWECVPEDVQNRELVMWNMASSCLDEGTDLDVELDGSPAFCKYGIFQYCEPTTFAIISPRNNSWTNRSQKGLMSNENGLSLLYIAIFIAGALLLVAAVSAGAAVYAKKNPNSKVARLFQNGGNRGSGIMNSPRYK